MRAIVRKLQGGRALMREPVLVVWSLYLLLTPIYVFASGLPQPGDMLIIPLAPMVIARWNGRLSPPAGRALRWLLAFTLYTIASAFAWTAIDGTFSINLKEGYLLSPAFYVFNALVFLLALIMHQTYGERFISITVRLSLAAVLIQVPLIALFGRTTGLRDSGLFNNPNQLGYYGVLSASIVLYGQRTARLSTMASAFGMLACTYMALISASKAALACIALLVIVSAISRLRTMLLSLAIGGVLFMTIDPIGGAVERTQRRLDIDQSESFLLERGYDRILEHPEYWILGSGEGGYRRFEDTTVIGDHELHSSGGTIFFCYGIAGTILFLGFLLQVLRVATFRQILLIVPAAAYGLTHQGLRVTMLWMLFAMFIAIADQIRRARATSRVGT